MSDYLLRRPTILSLTVLTILALGLLSFQSIGRQEDPTITNLFATIVTPFPGADPARVEALVTEKIEAELREIPEIKEIASTSRTGLSTVQIELSSFLPDAALEPVWSEIRDALTDAARAFPPGAAEPAFDNDRVGAFTMIAALTAADGAAVSRAVLGRVAEDLQNRLRQIPETKRVRVYGQPEEEILVAVDPDRAAALGLSPSDVARAIAAGDAKVSAGRVRGDAADFIVEVAGEIDGLSRVREIPVVSSDNGRVARVADLASVSRAARSPPSERAYHDGRAAVLVASRIEDDRQVDVWAAATRAEIETVRAALPVGLELAIVFDQSRYTKTRLGEVAANLALGVALVVSVLLLSMGWRAALIVGAALPLASLMSLAILERLGVVIHQMSVTGLIVALGLLVDAAIVMTDEIRRRLRDGLAPAEAARGAVGRLATPLAASTLTTVLAFTPMAALPGPAGDFVGAIAISVIVMLFCSLALALTVTPAMAARLLPAGAPARPTVLENGISGGLAARAFAASLRAALRWRLLSLGIASAPALVGFLAFPTLTAQFFPEVDRDQFHVQLELADGAAIAQTERAALKVDALLRADPDVVQVQWTIGRSAPAFYYNMLDNRDQDPRFAEALVTAASATAVERAIPRLQTALDAAAPEARALVRGLKQGPPVDAPIELRVFGPDLDTLSRLGEQARALMAATPAVTHTRADLSGAAPKLEFRLDEDEARLAGLSLGEVASRLDALSDGAVGGSLVEGPEELPVRVRADDAARGGADRLAALSITRQGADPTEAGFPAIPLAALGDAALRPSDGVIARRDGERVNTVQGFLAHGVLPDKALATFQARLAASGFEVPQGYRLAYGGESDARGETVRNLLSVVGLVAVASLATIVLTFGSWRMSGVALVVCLLSTGLSLLALEMFRYPFGIQALIGVIGAIGVSINAAIIVLTALQQDPDAAAGDRDAVVAVTLRSSRHIVSTTVTTFGGFLPLLLDGGGFWPPFAMAIAGGVLLSSIVSFYFVPPAFSLVAARAPSLGRDRDRDRNRDRGEPVG